MEHNDIASISAQDIRQAILAFLQQRLLNNNHYKLATAKLSKAQSDSDLVAINEAKQAILEIQKKFELENWMEDALIRRISWLVIATHLSKGIHPSSKAMNANYNTQQKSTPKHWVCSSTIDNLPYDATGSAAALDIFGLLNQKVNDLVPLLTLIIDEHPLLLKALSDDKDKSLIYLNNLKRLLSDNWDAPVSSELNKQFYWPNSDEVYDSDQDDNYRLLIPLHPSSLCHVVYQKVQERFSDENKQAREQRSKKSVTQSHYFSFHDLAIVQLGGRNAQNASQLIGSQMGKNYLLPSMPPTFNVNKQLKLAKHYTTIFANSLQYHCGQGFYELYTVIESKVNNKDIRERRKQNAFQTILAEIIHIAKSIQTQYPAGWSKDYQLNMAQKYWLDPHRATLDDEVDFARQYENGDWVDELGKQFALWINAILKKKFPAQESDFSDAEYQEWRREFQTAVKASQRKKEGVFNG